MKNRCTTILVVCALVVTLDAQEGPTLLKPGEQQAAPKKSDKQRLKEERKEAERQRKQAEWSAAYDRRRACGGSTRVAIKAAVDQVKAELVSRYTKAGFAISSDTQFQVTFFRDQEAQWNFFSAVLLGNSAPTHYKFSVQFQLTPDGTGSTVSGVGEAIVQDGYGRHTRYNLADNQQANDQICAGLLEVKTNVESRATETVVAKAIDDAAAKAQAEKETAERDAARARKEFAVLSEEALDYLAAAMAEVKSTEVIYKMELSKARDAVNKTRRVANDNDQREMAQQLAGLLLRVEECRRLNTPRTAVAFKQSKDGFATAEAEARLRVQALREVIKPSIKLTPAIGTVTER